MIARDPRRDDTPFPVHAHPDPVEQFRHFHFELGLLGREAEQPDPDLLLRRRLRRVLQVMVLHPGASREGGPGPVLRILLLALLGRSGRDKQGEEESGRRR